MFAKSLENRVALFNINYNDTLIIVAVNNAYSFGMHKLCNDILKFYGY